MPTLVACVYVVPNHLSYLQYPQRSTTFHLLGTERAQVERLDYEGRYKATWKREFKLPWRKAGLLISMIKWTRTSRLSIKISRSLRGITHAFVVPFSPLGPVDPSFRTLSGRLKFTVRRHEFNKDSFSSEGPSVRDTNVYGINV